MPVPKVSVLERVDCMLFVTMHCAMYVHILYTYFCGLTASGSPRMIQSRNYIEMLAVIIITIIVYSIHLQISSDSLILY